jgi:serine/threonine protein kinase
MSPSPLDRIADHFERLLALTAAQRVEALDALELDDDTRRQLERMLDTHLSGSDPLACSIAAGIAQLDAPRDRRLGHWRLLHEIGAGGMGTVFLAERIEGNFSQQAAIKLLRGFPTEDGKRRLRQERQILASLDHPHIARLLDGGEREDGQPWLAIEYIDGTPLLDYISQHAPSFNERLELFRSMLDAVEHAHQRLVIHRDLKPANVLVTKGGVVKLLDFGIARLLDLDASARQESSTRVFSRGYASPEQRAGETITTASDVYSLGVLLGEMLRGKRDDSKTDVALSALQIDRELGGIIAKASAEVAADRYGSVSELRDDLVRYQQGRPVRAAALTRRYRLRKFIGRHRVAVLVAMMMLMTLGAFIWRLDRERDRAVLAETIAQQALQRAHQDAQRANASLEFITEAFSAAAPERAMSRQVSVRQLLDIARSKLDSKHMENPELRQAMQRMLAALYEKLGEAPTAAELMQAGLKGLQPHDAISARSLIDDQQTFANVLGIVDRPQDALVAAKQAARWQEQFASEDLKLRATTLHSLGIALHRLGDNESAIQRMREARGLLAAENPAVVDPYLNTSLSSLLAKEWQCEEALKVAREGVSALQEIAPRGSPEYVPLLRSQASAYSSCGEFERAETTLREAIALQDRFVGSSGSHAMTLNSDLATVLNDLGRYREAAEVLARADVMLEQVGISGTDNVISWMNLAGILENAGDYAQALKLAERSIALLDQRNIPVDHGVRRSVERSYARSLALSGRVDEAFKRLNALRERSAQIDGKDAGEYAMLTWQLTLAARYMQRPDIGLPLIDEAERLWKALVPDSHPVLAHVLRARGWFALQQQRFDDADRYFGEAISRLSDAKASVVDIAIARSERAYALAKAKRMLEARELLAVALPILHDAMLEKEINRQRADQLARTLGLTRQVVAENAQSR